MRPYTDVEAGRQLMTYGSVFVLAKLVDGKQELFILDRKKVLEELQDEQKL